VSPSNTVSGIGINSARAIFSMRVRTWEDGTPIRVFVFSPSSEIHINFVSRTLLMLPKQLHRRWGRSVYAGLGQAPTVVNSQSEMMEKVSGTPGAIGYLEITEEVSSHVRIISLQP